MCTVNMPPISDTSIWFLGTDGDSPGLPFQECGHWQYNIVIVKGIDSRAELPSFKC